MTSTANVALSTADRERVEEIERLASAGPRNVAVVIARLVDPSWAVRRSAIAALAGLGDLAVGPMIEALTHERTSEAKIAALVDALSVSTGAPETAIEQLGEALDPAVVCDAAVILGRRHSSASAPVLAGWVLHPDDNVAVAAMEALGRIGGGAGLDAVVRAARSRQFFRVFPAIDVLARSGDPRAIATLAELLADPVCALEAARALGRTGELSAASALAPLLVSPNGQYVRIAALALADIEEHQARTLGATDTILPALRKLGDPTTAARAIERAFDGAEAEERIALCRALGWLGAESAAASLVELLASAPEIARAAALALKRLGPVGQRQILSAVRHGDSAKRALLLSLVPMHFEATKDVILCLDDPEPAVRARATEILGRIGNVAAVPALFGRLSDADASVAQSAVGALHGLGSQETERLALAGASDADARVRRASVRMIGYFGWARGLDTLLAALGDADARVREAATQSLAFLDDLRAVDALFRLSRGEDPRARASAMRALGQIDTTSASLDVLRLGLSDADAWVRYYASQSLGKLRATDALDALLPLLDDPAGQVRVAVIEALARLPVPRATEALVLASSSDDPDARRAALLGLGHARSARGLEAIVAASSSTDVSTRLVALSALASFDVPEAEALLARAAEDPDGSVRTAAMGFLGTRAGLAASERLITMLGDPLVESAAMDALSQHARGRVPAILAALEDADQARAKQLVSALVRMQRPDAIAAIAVALLMDAVETRRAAAAALAAVPSAASVYALEQAAHADVDAEVRRLASFALTRR